jgi:MFS family permease
MHNRVSWFFLFLLILAGESVFILPFVLVRVFRPTVLVAFGLDNLKLGLCFSVYGVVALLSYLFGGPLADRFSARKLMAIALWLTAAGGLLFSTYPAYNVLKGLYGYWGFTTIFLFWAPMIKATRVWGGQKAQGRAFGLLDGGRGLVGALFGALGVVVFSLFTGAEMSGMEGVQGREAFRPVILVASAIVALIGGLVWLFMKVDPKKEKALIVQSIAVPEILAVLRLPSVWLLMIIILCAYVGYKITDLFSLYASVVMQYDQVESAQVGTFLLFIRPVIGIIIGLAADRTQIAYWLTSGFVLAFVGSLLFAMGLINNSSTALFFVSTLIVAAGVYAARSLYFAVMHKGRIPLVLTGTAVGLISLISYTPEIFAGPLMGLMLEQSEGIQGHRHVFGMLAVFSLIGVIASGCFHWVYGKMPALPSEDLPKA